MIKQNRSNSLLWFYLVIVYVFIQFIWWSYLLISLNSEIAHLKNEVVLLKSNSPAETELTSKLLNEKLTQKRLMVIGEGVVFIALLGIGIYRIYTTHKKETRLIQQQSNFMLSVTHELKSPIASIRLQIETLLKRTIDKEKQQQILNNAINDTDRLNVLVENILLAAQLEQPDFIIKKDKINLSQLLNKIGSKPEYSANHVIEKNITLDLHANVDALAVESIMINLLDNACKYSAPNSIIKIELKSEGNDILIRVSDNGIGISTNDKKKIFDKFYRAGNEETRTNKGTGLGLYIVKRLVEEQGGAITVSDNQPQGTIFEIRFSSFL